MHINGLAMAHCVRRLRWGSMTCTRFTAAFAILCAAASLSALAWLTPGCDLNPHPLPPDRGFGDDNSASPGHGGSSSGSGGGPYTGGGGDASDTIPIVGDGGPNPYPASEGGSSEDAGGGDANVSLTDASADAASDTLEGDAQESDAGLDAPCDTQEAGE